MEELAVKTRPYILPADMYYVRYTEENVREEEQRRENIDEIDQPSKSDYIPEEEFTEDVDTVKKEIKKKCYVTYFNE